MATLLSIQKEIQKLEKEAEALKAREIQEVIPRIQEAIATYGLTEAQLFGKRTKATSARADVKRAVNGKRKAKPVIKYRDPATGNTWTGHGRRPAWYIAAEKAGKLDTVKV